MRSLSLTLAGAALLAACSSPDMTRQDARGNYATTSDYESMTRVELEAAMSAGLADVDKRTAELEVRAQSLGHEAIEELHDQLDDVTECRTDFVNELARLRAALDKDWEDRREDVVEAFETLRGKLDNAYEEVFEEA